MRSFPLLPFAALLLLLGCPSDPDDDDDTSSTGVVGGAPRNPLDAALIPVGSLAEGTTEASTADGVVFRFSFVGDESITYVIDTADAALQSGLLKVTEETTGAEPLAGAGLRYRDASGDPHPSPWLSNTAEVTLTSVGLTNGLLTLDYSNVLPNGTERSHRYEVELVGKALKVRVLDPNAGLEGADNFSGFDLGWAEEINDPVALMIPYMISTPLAKFTSTVDGSDAFFTTQTDWSRSSAPNYNQPWSPTSVDVTPSSIRNSYSFRYDLSIQGGLTASLDETFWVLVTRELSDTFPETEANPSPYRGTLAGRPVVLFSSPNTDWLGYLEQINLFDSWGMDNLALYYFYWWSDAQPPPGSSPPQVPSHIWVPARDEFNFFDLVDRSNDLGYLHGYYTLFSMNANQAHHDPEDACLDADSRPAGMAPARALAHSLREDGEMRTRYGTSLSFSDVLGYRHPRKRTDYDNTDTTRSKRIADVLADKRALFQQMQDIHEGPALSEGSIATLGSNYELLFAGFVDSTEATINGAGGAKASDMDVNDPRAPENWWVVPDYALEVTNRTQAPHSNGFYGRFYASLDNTFFPLSDARMDSYRIYSITYGKTGYFHSNGPINGQGNLMAYADMIKEYYLMAGLQQDYLSSTIDSVVYWIDGTPRDLQTVLLESTATNPLDDLRDARIQQTWQSGLLVYLNHSDSNWDGLEIDGVSYILPENGWVAHNPNTGFLAFSAIPEALASTGQRIDYALVPSRYEMLDGRGTAVDYGGLSSSTGWLVVANQFRGISLAEDADGVITTEQVSEPQVVAIELRGPDLIEPGHLTLLQAWATTDTGANQEFSYVHGDWSSSNPAVATVNRAGVVEALTEGTSDISFTAGTLVSKTHPITVGIP